MKMDDEKVTQVKVSDVLQLSGGGDWHIAYLMIQQRKAVIIEEKPDNVMKDVDEKKDIKKDDKDDDMNDGNNEWGEGDDGGIDI